MNKKGKIMIGISLISLTIIYTMFIISLTSVRADEISYDDKTQLSYTDSDMKAIIINKSNFGIIGNVVLSSHKTPTEIKNVFVGEDRAVMYYEFNNWEDVYENGLGEVTFTNMKTGEEIEKEYHFAEAIYREYEVPVFIEPICSNASDDNTCEPQIEKNFTRKQIVRWDKLDNTTIPKGNITIGLITDVEIGDYIDGVWEIVGQKIEKHATWSEGLNDGLRAYWSLNESSGNAIDWVNGTFNATLENKGAGGNINQNVAGLIGTAYKFTKPEQQLNLTNPSRAYNHSNMTMVFWINATGFKDQDHLLHLKSTGAFYSFMRYKGASNGWWFAGEDSGGYDWNFNSLYTLAGGKWQMVTIQFTNDGSGNASMWYNTTQVATDESVNLDIPNLKGMAIGTPNIETGYAFNGSLDEVGLWHRYLSASEITQLYNNGAGMTYDDFSTPPDSTPPNITILNPINTTYGGVAINHTIQVLDVTGVSSCFLSNDSWTTNITMNRSVNANHFNFTASTTLSDGGYKIDYWCNDTLGNANNSENIAFTIDSIFPEMVFQIPLNQTYTINFTKINYTFTEIHQGYCWWTNDSGTTTTTPTAMGNNFTINNLEGSTTIGLYCNDSADNTNSTNVTFYLDSENPSLNIIYPANNNYYTSKTQDLNFTRVDMSGFTNCWYSNDSGSSNITLSNCGNLTAVLWNEGKNNVSVWVNDSLGHMNKTNVVFYIDTMNPNISTSIDAMEEFQVAFADGSANFGIYYNITETNFGLANFSITNPNGTGYLKNSSSSQHQMINMTLTTEQRGVFSWRIWTNDSAGWFQEKLINFQLAITGAGGSSVGTITKINETITEGLMVERYDNDFNKFLDGAWQFTKSHPYVLIGLLVLIITIGSKQRIIERRRR